MPNLVKTTLSRAKTHPLILAIVVLTTILTGLASTGTAIETVSTLWSKWTHPAPALDTTWQGVWERPDGHAFTFVMRLTILSNDTAKGQIRWRLLRTPPDSIVKDRVNDEAIEFVSGTYNRDAHVVEVQGNRVSDPTLIIVDDYKFQILNDNVSFEAITRASGDRWDAAARGRVIVVPQTKRKGQA